MDGWMELNLHFSYWCIIRTEFLHILCCLFSSEVSCHQMLAHRRSSTPSVCHQVWGQPVYSKPPSTAPWISWPRLSTPVPITPRLWLPATLTPCAWTRLHRGFLSPTLYPLLPHQHLQMTQTRALRMDCGTSRSPLQPLSMVSLLQKAGDHFWFATYLNTMNMNEEVWPQPDQTAFIPFSAPSTLGTTWKFHLLGPPLTMLGSSRTRYYISQYMYICVLLEINLKNCSYINTIYF